MLLHNYSNLNKFIMDMAMLQAYGGLYNTVEDIKYPNDLFTGGDH